MVRLGGKCCKKDFRKERKDTSEWANTSEDQLVEGGKSRGQERRMERDDQGVDRARMS